VTLTWASSKLTIDTAVGAATTAFTLTDATRLGASSSQWDGCARIDVVAGDGASPRGQFLIGYYADATNYFLASVTSARDIGAFSSATSGGAITHTFAAGPSSGQATGGELWIRVSRTADGIFTVWWGVGTAGALPTAWTRHLTVDRAALGLALPTTSPIYVGGGWFGDGAMAAAWTVDVLAIRTTWQGSL
jgi:hypothetical protein